MGAQRLRWRLPLALLGAGAALLLGGARSEPVQTSTVAAMHVVAGHSSVAEGLPAVAHAAHVVGKPPVAVPAAATAPSHRLVRPRAAGPVARLPQLAPTPPTAIRGPPA